MVIDRANFKWKSVKKEEKAKKDDEEKVEIEADTNENDINEVPFNLTNLCLTVKKVCALLYFFGFINQI